MKNTSINKQPAIVLSLVTLLACTAIHASSSTETIKYCNKDSFYDLPDFSKSGYQNNCKRGDITRVKRGDVRRYCDSKEKVEIVSIGKKADSVVFDCKFVDVIKQKRSKAYQWKDNDGNVQFTSDPPPSDCVTRQCARIHDEVSMERDLESAMDDAVNRYQETHDARALKEKEQALSINPTLKAYFQKQSTSTLCQNLQFRPNSRRNNQYAERLMDLYNIESDAEIHNALAQVLGGRINTNATDIVKLFDLSGNLWVGMHENLLHCARPVPYLTYKPASRVSAPLRQYIYEVGTNFEYVDVQNGTITNIRSLPIAPDI